MRRRSGTMKMPPKGRLLLFKPWIPAFAGMTTTSFGGLRQKASNFQPRVQQNPLHPFGGVNTR